MGEVNLVIGFSGYLFIDLDILLFARAVPSERPKIARSSIDSLCKRSTSFGLPRGLRSDTSSQTSDSSLSSNMTPSFAMNSRANAQRKLRDSSPPLRLQLLPADGQRDPLLSTVGMCRQAGKHRGQTALFALSFVRFVCSWCAINRTPHANPSINDQITR